MNTYFVAECSTNSDSDCDFYFSLYYTDKTFSSPDEYFTPMYPGIELITIGRFVKAEIKIDSPNKTKKVSFSLSSRTDSCIPSFEEGLIYHTIEARGKMIFEITTNIRSSYKIKFSRRQYLFI